MPAVMHFCIVTYIFETCQQLPTIDIVRQISYSGRAMIGFTGIVVISHLGATRDIIDDRNGTRSKAWAGL